MKKFEFILIPSLVASLTALSACDQTATMPRKVCVDGSSSDQRVEDERCTHTGGVGFPYYWYYMRGGMGAPPIGGSIRGFNGSTSPEVGATYSGGVSRGGVTRGGFGSSASGFGSSGE